MRRARYAHRTWRPNCRRCWASGTRRARPCSTCTPPTSRASRRGRPTPSPSRRAPRRSRRSSASAAAHGVPVIPWGAGSSLEGHVLPVQGGLALDLTRMDRVLDVSAENLDCRVQPGVTRLALERRLGADGLFFAVDPGADATLGGMAATAASGTLTTRYGTMRENVLALEAVLADGTVMRTGTRARKSSAGYDLTRLLLGSEGTLGVITELTLRIHGIPEQIAAARCAFETLDGLVATVTQAVQLGIPVARCDLLDAAAIAAVNEHSGLHEAEAPTLFLEFHGGPESVAEQVASRGRDRGRERRRRARLDLDHRGAQPAVARPPQRLLRRARAAAGHARADHRRVRAGVRAGRLHHRLGAAGAPSCPSPPRWSATSPTATSTGSARSTWTPRPSAPSWRASSTAWWSARSPPAAPAPASTASASASASTAGAGRPGGGRDDAGDQAGARPRERAEPGEGPARRSA